MEPGRGTAQQLLAAQHNDEEELLEKIRRDFKSGKSLAFGSNIDLRKRALSNIMGF